MDNMEWYFKSSFTNSMNILVVATFSYFCIRILQAHIAEVCVDFADYLLMLLSGLLLSTISLLIAYFWRGDKKLLSLTIFFFLFYVGGLSGQIDALIFTTIPRSIILLEVIVVFAISLLFSLIFSKLYMGKTDDVVKFRIGAGLIVKFVALAFVYVILYLLVGGIFYELFTKPFYASMELPLILGESIDLVSVLIPLQIFRSLLFVLATLPIILYCRGIRGVSLGVFAGLALWVVGGLCTLLNPNPYMPAVLRFYHVAEIFFQNFPWA